MILALATKTLIFLLPIISTFGLASPVNLPSDLSDADLFALSVNDFAISSIFTDEESKTEDLNGSVNDPDSPFVGNQGTFNFDLLPNEAGKALLESRKISPWPHFRECKKHDPRPECPHHKRSDDEDAEIFDAFAETEPTPVETRQISPWPHFRECKHNDPRPECPHYKRYADVVEEGFETDALIDVPRTSVRQTRNEHRQKV